MRLSALVLFLLATVGRGVYAQDSTDAPKRYERLSLKHSISVNEIAFSRDGKRLASAGEDGTIKVWNASTGEHLLTLEGHSMAAQDVAFSPDGNRIASASDDQTVRLWDANSGKELLVVERHTASVQSVVFSPDGNRLASGSEDATVLVCDSMSGRELLKFDGHSERVQTAVFSPDGSRIASGGDDGNVMIWDAAAGTVLLTLRGHDFAVADIEFTRDGDRLASASWDDTVKIWDARTGEELLTLQGHVDNIYGVAFRSDGKLLASASRDGWVKVWDTSTGENLHTLVGRNCVYATDVAFSPDDTLLASAGNVVRVWDFEEPSPPTTNAPSSLLSAPRVWTDSSGDFTVKATFIRIEEEFVLLLRDDNAKEIRVPLDRLSESDLALLERETKSIERDTKSETPEPDATVDIARDEAVAQHDGVLALAGFNNRTGLGTRRGRAGPYQLDTVSVRAGNGEPGWNGAWSATEKATAQTKSVFEGDGALHLVGTAGVRRGFAGPLTDIVEIEQYVCVPAGGHVICYVWEQDHNSAGPMWSVNDGKFLALEGNERGSGTWIPTGETAEEDEWIKVVVEIDTENRRWKLKLPNKDYVSTEMKYRGTPKALLAIHYLAETPAGVFIDAIQIRQAKSK